MAGEHRLWVIGHRGAAARAPENSLAAFDTALAMGVDGIETDIRQTRDGVLVLLHDATVDRTTDGIGAVADLTFAQLRALDAGASFAARYAGERMPTLDEFLQRYGSRTWLRLESKAPGVEAAVLALVARHGLLVRVWLTSFAMEIVERLHELEPAAALAFLTSIAHPDEADRARSAGCVQIAYPAGSVTRALVDDTHARGLQAWAWAVRSPELLEHVIACGIDGVTLDDPSWATGQRETGRRGADGVQADGHRPE